MQIRTTSQRMAPCCSTPTCLRPSK